MVERETRHLPERASLPAPRVEYGMPAPELMAEAERGDVLLGGCDPGDPVELNCPTCSARVLWPSGGVRLRASPPEEGSADPRLRA